MQHILGFTGLAFCDIDHIDDVDKAFEQVTADQHTLIAYKTVGRHGLRVIYRYVREQSDAHIDSVSWQAAFLKGNGHFAWLTGQEFDNQCANYNHLCGLAHDEHVFFNDNAEPFIITDEEILETNFAAGSEHGKPRKEHAPGSFEVSVEDAWVKVQSILAKRNLTFQPGHHHDYVMHASFLFNRFGTNLDELMVWAAQEWNTYNEKQREATIRSCYKKTDEHGTWQLNRQGKKKENAMITLPEIAAWLTQHYEMKYDEVTDMTSCRIKGSKKWETVDNRILCTIRQKITEDSGKRVLKSDVQDVIWSDVTRSVHPVRDYLSSLPKWDGTDRIAELASCIIVEPAQANQTYDDAHQLLCWAMHKWMVGNVAMWMNDNQANHQMLVFVGPQGIYKTTFFRSLLPQELRNLYWENTHNSFSSKDDHIALGENCLAEIEEFDITKPQEIGELKSLLTAVSIKERKPYARQREEKHRLAGFCGTCNEQHFLADETGNRRFLCFLISRIKHPSEWNIDFTQLYAQLRDEYQSGFQFWFNHDEELRMEQQNAAFRLESDEEMLIRTNFRKPEGNESGELMNAATIAQYINGGRLGNGISSKRIASIMKRLKYQLVHKKTGNFFRVVKIPYEQRQAEITKESDNTKTVSTQTQEGNLPF